MASVISRANPVVPALPVDAVVLGEALIDLFPEQPGLPLEDCERFVRHLGGAPCNLAVNLARQGIPTVLVTLVGTDALGRFVQKRLASEGVFVDGVQTHKTARTGITLVSIGARGERSFLSYRPQSADMMLSPGDIPAALIERGRLFHFGSSLLSREPARAATLRALELASKKRERRLISCDVNLRPALWPELKEAPPLLRKLLASCDVVKLTQEELPLLFGTESVEAAAAAARKLGAQAVTVTMGSAGSYLDCPAGQSHFAPETVSVLDKTGAGDAFCAGLLSVLLQELRGPVTSTDASADDLRVRLRGLTLAQWKRACARGNHLGALACTALGATTAVPRL